MNVTSIDLASNEFWLIFAIAVALLTPLRHATARRWVWAGVNVGLLAWLMKLHVAEILAAVALIHLMLTAIARWQYRALITVAGASVVLGLFVCHKLPNLLASVGVTQVNPLLATIGFSYVMLRLIDVTREVYEGRQPPPDPASTVNYLIPFHMLAAGPIQDYDAFASQPAVPKALTTHDALAAAERIGFGLFKKFVAAYCIEKVLLTGFRSEGGYFFFEVQMYYLWVYIDFSAYSDIAVGVGRLMGVATPENFDRPYLARNLIDFWERWHISLSQFIRRNIFIPLQLGMIRRSGGRYPLWIATLAFTVAFLLCGLWHGISWVFFSWGAMHAAGLVATNLYRSYLSKKIGKKGVKQYLANRWYRLAARIVTFEYVAFSLTIVGYPWQEIFR